MDQCCCGRIKECDEVVIINQTQHEPLGPAGNFCGPVDHHTIRDQDKEIERLRKIIEYAGVCLDQGYSRESVSEQLRSALSPERDTET